MRLPGRLSQRAKPAVHHLTSPKPSNTLGLSVLAASCVIAIGLLLTAILRTAAAPPSPSATISMVAKRTATPRPRPTQRPTQPPPLPAPAPSAPPVPTPSPEPSPTASVIEPWALVWNGGNLRSAPDLQASVVGGVAAGDQVRLAAWAGDWWLVRAPSGLGWLSGSLLTMDPLALAHVPFAVEAVPQFSAAQVVQGGNLRASPERDASIVGNVETGDILHVQAQDGEWWQVRTARGLSWMHQSLAKLDPRGTQVVAGIPDTEKTPNRPAVVAQPRWPIADGPGNLLALVDVDAPHPYLAPGAIAPFNRARSRVLAASGVDYLGRIDEAFRGIGFQSAKPGVADRSWHKAGRAIDLIQWQRVGGKQGVVFVRDTKKSGYWRVLLRCARQDGSLGAWYTTKTTQGRGPAAYYVDVTSILEAEGWNRIQGFEGVTEAWHYEYQGGLSWRTAMLQLYSRSVLNRFFP